MQLPDFWRLSTAKIELLVKDVEEKGGSGSGSLSQKREKTATHAKAGRGNSNGD